MLRRRVPVALPASPAQEAFVNQRRLRTRTRRERYPYPCRLNIGFVHRTERGDRGRIFRVRTFQGRLGGRLLVGDHSSCSKEPRKTIFPHFPRLRPPRTGCDGCTAITYESVLLRD